MVSFFILGGTPPPSKYPLSRRLRGHQSLCGRCREGKRLWTVLNRTMIPALSSHLYTGRRTNPAVCTVYLCRRRIVILLSLKGKQSSMSVSVRHFQFLKRTETIFMTMNAYATDGQPIVVRSFVQLLKNGKRELAKRGRQWRNLTLILKLHMHIYV